MYIILEGIDRVGKSTQIELLKDKFKDAIFTKEPGGTEFGKKIREILLNEKISDIAEILLFLSDRAEHIDEVIKPNLDKLIISDRGFISGIAYAHIKTKISYEKLFELNRFAMQDIMPQKIVFFKISKDELEKRMHIQKLDSIEKRGIKYLLDVQDSMQKALEICNCNYIIIDASLKKEEIFKKIVNYIKG